MGRSTTHSGSATLAAMLKKIFSVLRLLLVLAAIILFAKAMEFLILNGGFSGAFYDIIFFRK
jgi:hypothetical protein